jgi:hypothetical protein
MESMMMHHAIAGGRNIDFNDPNSMAEFMGPMTQQRVGGVGFRGSGGRSSSGVRMSGGRGMAGGIQSGMHSGMYGMEDDDDDEYYPGRGGGRGSGGGAGAADQYDEDGVRRPDPVRLQRLMSGGAPAYGMAEGDAALARADALNVEWMFPPPSHLSYPGPLQEVGG